ncbi:hypothetical protein CY35_17G090300 [Sphagnum magellanicum]|nr:hypothetical protein CY35_17G090300 [Sphagnum magellanicum]KAH9536119.1 hypothetical protein CY35_17G090300 [Sphagnum magellanicum]
MAQIPVLSRQRFCVEEEKKLHELPLSSSTTTLETNSSLGITTRSHVPPQEEERRNAVAIEVVADDDEEEEEDEEDVEAVFTSFANPRPTFNVVALGKSASQETSIKPVKWWSRIQDSWVGMEDKLVQWFGLEQSKYQWAIDEFMDHQLSGDNQKPAVQCVEELHLQQWQEQAMQRNQQDLPASFTPPQKDEDVSK